MWIVFEKGKLLRHIGHLDLMRSMQRALRRSGLPIGYSQGFNPHVLLTFASPLSVGIWGVREIMDVAMTCEVSSQEVIDSLNKALPPELRVIDAFPVVDGHPKPMALVTAAEYQATIAGEDGAKLAKAIPTFLAQEEIPAIRKTKKGDKPCDIRPMIFDLSAKEADGELTFSMTLALNEAATCKPELLFTALCQYAQVETLPRMDIVRIRLFMMNDQGILQPLEQI